MKESKTTHALALVSTEMGILFYFYLSLAQLWNVTLRFLRKRHSFKTRIAVLASDIDRISKNFTSLFNLDRRIRRTPGNANGPDAEASAAGGELRKT